MTLPAMSSFPEYRDNPFLDRLPPILSEQEAVTRLRHLPDYSPKMRGLPSEQRVDLTSTLQQVVIPTFETLEIQSVISRLIRQSYRGRELDGRPKVGDAIGYAIVGATGVGKSTAVRSVLNLYPSVIEHREHHGRPFTVQQVPKILLTCPYDGSVKGLLFDFFRALDQILHTDYARSYGKGTADRLITNMYTAAANHALGLLVIDEIQHLLENPKRNINPDQMLNFLVTVENTINVPVVLIGTPKAMNLFDGKFRQVRRVSAAGNLHWGPMRYDKTWDLLLKRIWKYQYTATETPLTEELSRAFYHHTQGFVALLVTMYKEVQVLAIQEGREVITPELLDRLVQTKFSDTLPVIHSLRSGRNQGVDLSDVELPDNHEFFEPSATDEAAAAEAPSAQEAPPQTADKRVTKRRGTGTRRQVPTSVNDNRVEGEGDLREGLARDGMFRNGLDGEEGATT